MPHFHLVRTESAGKRVYSGYLYTRDYSQVPGAVQEAPFQFVSSDHYPDTRPIYRVPNRKWLIATGAQAATPYTRVASYVTQEAGQGVVHWKTDHGYGVGVAEMRFLGVPYLQKLTSHISTTLKADNQALNRFYAAIRAEQEHMNALISLGEARETVRMLRRPFAGVQRLCNDYLTKVEGRAKRIRWKRNKPPTPDEIKRILSESWLEQSFGWRPFLADIRSAAETMARIFESTRRSAVQGYGEFEHRSPNRYWNNEQIPGSWFYFDTVGSYSTKIKVKYRAGLNAQYGWPDGSWRRAQELSGFVPENFVPTVYNLLPWSFLADYFTTVGTCLSSYYTSTASVTWAVQSELVVSERGYQHYIAHDRIRAALGGNYVASGGNKLGNTVAKYLQFTRTLLDVGNLPAPIMESKRLSDISPLQGSNILALLGARTKAVRSALLSASRG